jgi:CRP-like cAMP-binding protein
MEDSSKVNISPKDLESLRRSTAEAVVDGPRPIGPPRRGVGRPETQKPIAFNGLLTNKILTALPGPDFARLLPYLEPVSLFAGEDVYIFGEDIDFIYFPETVVISHLYLLEDGSITGAAIVGNEGVVGISAVLDSRPALYWTQVTVGGTAVRLRPNAIRDEFARGGAMQRLLLAYTRARLAQLSQRAACNGRHSLRERLCTWLLMVHDRVGDEDIPLTHENIAHQLGARRAGVSTECTALRERGIIAYRRGRLRISNRALLEQVACECYRALGQFD